MNDAPTKAKGGAAAGYRVLARKYRPQSFADLIGQEALVRTLTNAFARGRIAQAYMLTGVRGVGKTTTARIIARALNYSQPGRPDAPSLEMDEIGEHCAAIMESRHVDVIEMDAASHTGIGDIREIIDSVRYRPVSARYKVYIIDEVHMLSTQAFNGLLKTLEEPPEHVKFIFATTEIRKVPVTVLSRCQRFDLRRVDAGRLRDHLKWVCGEEGVAAEEEALAVIARAAEGSVRDGLSILDQAIAHGSGEVTAGAVRDMLGFADRSRVVDLFAHVMGGDVARALSDLRELYDTGADPLVVLTDLAEFVHLVTRVRFVPDAGEDPGLSQAERDEAKRSAQALDVPVLGRAWQVLVKGIEEVQTAPRPLVAAEMVLVRLAHMADLPTPDDLIRLIKDADEASADGGAEPGAARDHDGPSAGPRAAPRPASRGGASPVASPALDQQAMPHAASPGPDALASYPDLLRLASERRDAYIKVALEQYVRPVALEPGRLEIGLTEDAPANLVGELSKRLHEWTGRRWMVVVSSGAAAKTLSEEARERDEELRRKAAADPQVRAVLEAFPGAEITAVHETPRGTASDFAEASAPDDEDEL
jgi:DNA polymerase-3 subunit gamma/tau